MGRVYSPSWVSSPAELHKWLQRHAGQVQAVISISSSQLGARAKLQEALSALDQHLGAQGASRYTIVCFDKDR